ncbi:hypothetical protein [Desulfovibrio litoralis]|uniref:Uncharacterized protein n=1 Tax=Desulfovibrio litoralis DSM 11393 TaxID=1121455 RepID=A0A1M7TLA4_9BACT|nr:hypothetical protein [Desulfovibrio litoralis]SHN71490.1 hypothetical protein SAMN02745728_02196 [Desulfovibrio litoralis DSM 11393]
MNGVTYDWRDLEKLGLSKKLKVFIPISEASFKNVTIRGGDWKNLELLGGKWENVNIYPEINMDNASIDNVKAYNVNYPEGAPFRGTPTGKTTINVSKTPLDWPEIHVPTFEELGFNRELPEITGKP